MDAVAAFSLAANILQVVDLSFRALSTCRENYKDGSLSRYRSAQKITKELIETTRRLEAMMQNTSNSRSRFDLDIADMSTKCSRTADDLVAELSELSVKPGGSRRDAVTQGFRTWKKRKALKEIQDSLVSHQRLLDTRILAGLKSHSVQQRIDLTGLDQRVRDLATFVEQGQTTAAYLVNRHAVEITNHIDRRLDGHTQIAENYAAQQQFQSSLFFPEIYSRQDDIKLAHQGTCQWIFEDAVCSGDEGKEPYWLSGKPGSGKSTLMKYIATEFRTRAAKESASNEKVIVASFYFWTRGSALQKTLIGLMRSILFQIGCEKPDMVCSMMDNDSRQEGVSFQTPLPAWTESRLLQTLKQCLLHLPVTVSLYLFIDGLDEIRGDEDDLIGLVQHLSRTPRVKVCVSSRPERIFYGAFAKPPRIRLQELNQGDIKKSANDLLLPVLTKYFPDQKQDVQTLIFETVAKAEGVFLWLELMVKCLKRGAANGDTIVELHDILRTTPDTIEGMYDHMLGRMAKTHQREAYNLFALLIAFGEVGWGSESFALKPTLLHFACSESKIWQLVQQGDLEYFASPEFMRHCSLVENRILARCAGLVEISQNSSTNLTVFERHSKVDDEVLCPYLSGGLYGRPGHDGPNSEYMHPSIHVNGVGNSPARHFRKISFIHKTAGDFLRDHKHSLLQDLNDPESISCALARSQLGVIHVLPLMTWRPRIDEYLLISLDSIEWIMASLIKSEDLKFEQETDSTTQKHLEKVYHAYQNSTIMDSIATVSHLMIEKERCKSYGDERGPPFDDVDGFAAFYGCRGFLFRSEASRDFTQTRLDDLLKCTLLGLSRLHKRHFVQSSFAHPDVRLQQAMALYRTIRQLLCLGANPNEIMHMPPEQIGGKDTLVPPWSKFIMILARFLGNYISGCNAEALKCLHGILKAILSAFMEFGADTNAITFEVLTLHIKNAEIIIIQEATPLSLLYNRTRPENQDAINVFRETLRSRGGIHHRQSRFLSIRKSSLHSGRPYHSQTAMLEMVIQPYILLERWYRLSQHHSDLLETAAHHDVDRYHSDHPVMCMGHAIMILPVLLKDLSDLDLLGNQEFAVSSHNELPNRDHLSFVAKALAVSTEPYPPDRSLAYGSSWLGYFNTSLKKKPDDQIASRVPGGSPPPFSRSIIPLSHLTY